MFIIYLMLFSIVSTVPRRYKYNCFSMQAEVFPIEKIPQNYRNFSYQLRLKYEDGYNSNKPKYDQKIEETKTEIAKLIPDDHDKAKAQYLKFKDMLLARADQVNFTQSAEAAFRDRIWLLMYNITLGDMVYNDFKFLLDYDPVEWLDKSPRVTEKIKRLIYWNYSKPGKERPKKDISTTDHCTQLAHSLSDDPGWKKGTAKGALKLVFRCYDIFPYSDDAAQNLYDLNLLMLEFFVFSNYTTQGIGSSIVFRTLKEQAFNFDSNLHFHDYFNRMLSALNDAHISYKIDCYEQFTFIQPVYIQMQYDRNTVTGHHITKVNSPELEVWVGTEIIAINGEDPFYAIYYYGEDIGKSHNGYNRYTLGLSRLYYESSSQDFLWERGLYLKRTSIPNKSYLIYKLKMQDERIFEVKIDWSP